MTFWRCSSVAAGNIITENVFRAWTQSVKLSCSWRMWSYRPRPTPGGHRRAEVGRRCRCLTFLLSPNQWPLLSFDPAHPAHSSVGREVRLSFVSWLSHRSLHTQHFGLVAWCGTSCYAHYSLTWVTTSFIRVPCGQSLCFYTFSVNTLFYYCVQQLHVNLLIHPEALVEMYSTILLTPFLS